MSIAVFLSSGRSDFVTRVLSARSFMKSAKGGKFVFIGSVLRLSGPDISATHNPLREELAVSDISPVTAWALALHHVTAIRSQLAQE